MIVTFDSPKTIVTIPQVTKTVSTVNVVQLTDLPESKVVFAYTAEVGRITLWTGSAYDTIGQWTDTDVVNRIKELNP